MKFGSIVEALASHAAATPDHLCLVDEKKTCTYAQAWQYIRLFSESLKALGLKPGDRVVVHMNQSIEAMVAALGIHLAGGVFVPVEKNIADSRIIEIMTFTDAEILVAVQPIKHDCAFVDLNTLCQPGRQPGPADDQVTFPRPDALSEILFTTGTTGKTKGVMLSFRNQLDAAENVVQAAELTDQDVYMIPQALSHSSGIRRSYAALLAGAVLVIQNDLVFIKEFFDAMNRCRVTVLSLVPAYLALLLELASEELQKYRKQLRVVQLMSTPTPEAQKARLCELLPETRFFNSYGATEAGAIADFEFSRYPGKANCIGTANINSRIVFMDDDGYVMAETAKDRPGLVTCEGPTIMQGYWKDPDLTTTVLKGGRLILSDLGYTDEDGHICLLGRRDDVINTGGNKVSPTEIEELVMRMPGIKECACVPMPDKIMGHVPKLYVVMKSGHEFLQQEIYAYLSGRLEAFKVPRIIEQLDALPRTTGVGKINRKALIKEQTC